MPNFERLNKFLAPITDPRSQAWVPVSGYAGVWYADTSMEGSVGFFIGVGAVKGEKPRGPCITVKMAEKEGGNRSLFIEINRNASYPAAKFLIEALDAMDAVNNIRNAQVRGAVQDLIGVVKAHGDLKIEKWVMFQIHAVRLLIEADREWNVLQGVG